jgi:hypothetical protein
VESDFNVCPYCKTLLREPCKSCSKPIRTNWMACPYCATDRAPMRPTPTPRVPAAASSTQPVQPPQRPAPGAQPVQPLQRPATAARTAEASPTTAGTQPRPRVSPPAGP